MTSLHVICGLGPPNQKSWLRLCGHPYAIPIDKDVFLKLMFTATQGLFKYKDKLYKQMDGVTMGSCLGPTLANFFSGCLKEKLFANTNNLSPNLY